MAKLMFTQAKNRWFFRLALLTTLISFVLILLGAYIRLMHTGIACPDWPQCFGYLTLPHSFGQLRSAISNLTTDAHHTIKSIHHYLSITVAVLILLLAFSSLLLSKKLSLKPFFICLGLLVLVASQIALSSLDVTEKLRPVIVLGHFLIGLGIVSLLWWLCLMKRAASVLANKSLKKYRFWAWLGFWLLLFDITLGGWVSTNYAGLVCIDFPYCNGVWIPPMDWKGLLSITNPLGRLDINTLITIHMLHRIGAIALALYLGLFSLLLLSNRYLRHIALLTLCLLGAEVVIGGLNVIWQQPIWLVISHSAIATLLLLTLMTLLINLYRKPQDYW